MLTTTWLMERVIDRFIWTLAHAENYWIIYVIIIFSSVAFNMIINRRFSLLLITKFFLVAVIATSITLLIWAVIVYTFSWDHPHTRVLLVNGLTIGTIVLMCIQIFRESKRRS